MKNKKILSLLALSATGVLLAACGGGSDSGSSTDSSGGSSSDKTVVKVAALESGYGADMWTEIEKAYEAENPDIDIELTTDKKLEDVISPDMKAGNYPDVILLATGREAGLTETFIKDKNLEDLTDVFDMTVPGEDVTVKEKLIPGFIDTLATNPYNDGKTYLAPMFYSPTGLFYNSGLLEEKGWEVPTTWDEMWELGDKAAAEDIALFTYPTTGYLDSFFFSLLPAVGGPDFYNDAMSYVDGTWASADATESFDIATKLASYTAETTPANANDQDFTKNQQMILDNQAIFMPNGTWVVGEMEEAPRADGFAWGMTALPATEAGGDQYSYTFFEQMWMPTGAENKDGGKDFIAWMYSDAAADIFAESGAIQPIEGMSDKLTGDNQLFYSIYDNGAKAVMGGFENTATVEGVSIRDTLFGTYDSIVSGTKTEKEWQDDVVSVTDQLREAAEQ
ncbi:carbohydrate ABC transporter substrate-binding protein [Enterococcus sp. HY326]|uniref:carbohydrate ABC transporter substrate-binding protein n=1 Tax=Enterococcus sp. HY326 TaxID=2971265 RepID=UPI00223E91C1|nr:carbohydrate ABC transporter substrate-binding protein [Enterococcus sp. HY326]